MNLPTVFCTNCGARRGENDLFCRECGTQFADAPPPPPPPAPAPADQRAEPTPPPPAPQPSPPPTPSAPGAQQPRRPAAPWVLVPVVVLLLLATAGGGILLLSSHHTSPPSSPPAAAPARPTHSASPSPAPTTTPSVAATTEQTFTELYKNVADGVVRIETTACAGGAVGSGFLVAPNMVATVAHVVADSVTVVVRDGPTTTTGTVVGYDPDHELALVRTAIPLHGHVFGMDTTQPDVGTDIAAIGYPLGGPQSLSKGAVSGLGRRIVVEGHHLRDLLQTDASINPGNSGGPLLAADGTVVGLVEAKRTNADNIGYAIPASLAAAQLRGWEHHPTPVHWVNNCSAPSGPDGVPVDISEHTGHPDAAAIGQAFATYVNGINSGDYASAYAVLSPRDQQKVSYRRFSEGNVSSFIVQLSIDSIRSAPDGSDKVEVRFTSVQDPSYGVHGQDCSDWTITYTMVKTGSRWRIDAAIPHAGSPAAC